MNGYLRVGGTWLVVAWACLTGVGASADEPGRWSWTRTQEFEAGVIRGKIGLDRAGKWLVFGGYEDRTRGFVGRRRDRALADAQQENWVNGETRGVLQLWDFETGEAIGEFEGRCGAIFAAAISPDGKLVATGGRTPGRVEKGPKGGEVKLWDIATRRERATLGRPESWVTSVAFSPDGKLVAAGGFDRVVRVWDVATGRQVVALPPRPGSIAVVAFHRDGRLASVETGGRVKLWEPRGWAESGRLDDRSIRYVFDAVFSPDGKHLALSGSRNSGPGKTVGSVMVWDLSSREARALDDDSRDVYASAFSPDGRLLALVDDTLRVTVLDLAAGAAEAVIPRNPRISSSNDQVLFLPGGHGLLFTQMKQGSGRQDTFQVWKVEE